MTMPERFWHLSQSQLIYAWKYGGMWVNHVYYVYDPTTDSLIREDIVRREEKQADVEWEWKEGDTTMYAEVTLDWQGTWGDWHSGICGIEYVLINDEGEIVPEVIQVLLPAFAPQTDELRRAAREEFYKWRRN